MRISIVSDHEPTNTQVREVLAREAPECLPVTVIPFRQAVDGLGPVQPDLVIVSLAPAIDSALDVLKVLRLQTRAGLLAIGPASDPRLILRVLQAGANSYVDAADL